MSGYESGLPFSNVLADDEGSECFSRDKRISSRSSFIMYGLMLYSPFGYFPGPLSVFLTDPAFTSSVSRAEIVEGSMPLARERAVGDMLGNSVFPIRWEKYVPIR